MSAKHFAQTWCNLVGLARARFRSTDDYYRFQQFQAIEIIHSLEYLRAGAVDVALDLGSGTGGYSSQLVDIAKTVIALDRYKLPHCLTHGIQFVQSDAISIPMRNESVDFVFCASLIEHLENPELLLAEIFRVLNTRGQCYLSFPPFYSLNGGHQYKPYHWLGEWLATRIARAPHHSYSNAFGQWGLYRLTVRKARSLIKESGLEIRHESTRFMPFNFAKVPIVGEVLCWHVEFVLAKRVTAAN